MQSSEVGAAATCSSRRFQTILSAARNVDEGLSGRWSSRSFQCSRRLPRSDARSGVPITRSFRQLIVVCMCLVLFGASIVASATPKTPRVARVRTPLSHVDWPSRLKGTRGPMSSIRARDPSATRALATQLHSIRLHASTSPVPSGLQAGAVAVSLTVNSETGNDTKCFLNAAEPCKTLAGAAAGRAASASLLVTLETSGVHVACNVSFNVALVRITSACTTPQCRSSVRCDGCAFCLQSAHVTLDHVSITDSAVAAVYYGLSLSVTNVDVSNHTGAWFYRYDNSASPSTLQLVNVTFANNMITTQAYGGVVDSMMQSASFQSCWFINNSLSVDFMPLADSGFGSLIHLEAYSNNGTSFSMTDCHAMGNYPVRVIDDINDNVASLVFVSRAFTNQVTSSTFRRNGCVSVVYIGTAYDTDNTQFSLDQSEFTDNGRLSTNSTLTACVVWAPTATGRFTQSVFDRNANGGLFIIGSTAATVTVNRLNFTENLSLKQGAAAFSIYAGFGSECATNVISLSNSVFTRNRAAYDGGAVALSLTGNNNSVSMRSVAFINNTAFIGPGGAFSLRAFKAVTDWMMDSCQWIGNSANTHGGAVYAARDQTRLLWTNSVFELNHANQSGGAILLQRAELNFTNVNFTSNSADVDGGALNAYPSTPLIGVSPDADTPDSSTSAVSEALGSAVILQGCTFVDNTALGSGGAVFFTGSQNFSILFSNFTGNIASNGGGACFLLGIGGVHFTQVHFTSNTITEQHVQQFAELGYTEISGGAVALLHGGSGDRSRAQFSNCSFRDNTAPLAAGGGISAMQATLTVSHSSFHGQKADVGGALMVGLDSALSLRNNSFVGNIATQDGGAAYLAAFDSLNITACRFENNSAIQGDGGAMQIEASISVLDVPLALIGDSVFKFNIANMSGGAVIIHDGRTQVVSCVFINNSAKYGGGGGVFLEGQYSGTLVHLQNTFEASNTAWYGPLWATPVDHLTVQNAAQYSDGSFVQFSGNQYPIKPPIIVWAQDYFNQSVTMQLPPTSMIHELTDDAGRWSDGTGESKALRLNGGFVNFTDISYMTKPGNVQLVFTAIFHDAENQIDITPAKLTVRFEPCPPGTSMANDTFSCRNCDVGTYSNQSGLPACVPCPAGSAANDTGMTSCTTCEAGTVAITQQRVCAACGLSNRYSLRPGQSGCLECTAAKGISCLNGHPAVSPGFWWPITNSTVVLDTYRCLTGYCLGSADPVKGTTCASTRLSTSPLCSECPVHHVQYPSNPKCLPCAKTNGGMVFLYLLSMWFVVLLAFWFAGRKGDQTSELKIFLFFFTSLKLVLGPMQSWSTWLGFVNGQGALLFENQCILAWDPYDSIMIIIPLPLMALVELAFTALVIRLLIRYAGLHSGWFHVSRLIRTASVLIMIRYGTFTVRSHFLMKISSLMAIFTDFCFALYSFNAVCTQAFLFLYCVPAGPGGSRVEVFPVLDCNSERYKTRQAVVYFFIFGWLVVMPLALLCFLVYLYRARKLNEPHVIQRWGFFYRSYRAPFFWLEPVLLIRRILIVVMAVNMRNDPLARSASLVFLFVLFLMIQAWTRPYEQSSANLFEGMSLATLAILSALMANEADISTGSYPAAVRALVVMLVLLVGGILFTAVVLQLPFIKQHLKPCKKRLKPCIQALRRCTSDRKRQLRTSSAYSGVDSLSVHSASRSGLHRRVSSSSLHDGSRNASLHSPLLIAEHEAFQDRGRKSKRQSSATSIKASSSGRRPAPISAADRSPSSKSRTEVELQIPAFSLSRQGRDASVPSSYSGAILDRGHSVAAFSVSDQGFLLPPSQQAPAQGASPQAAGRSLFAPNVPQQ